MVSKVSVGPPGPLISLGSMGSVGSSDQEKYWDDGRSAWVGGCERDGRAQDGRASATSGAEQKGERERERERGAENTLCGLINTVEISNQRIVFI